MRDETPRITADANGAPQPLCVLTDSAIISRGERHTLATVLLPTVIGNSFAASIIR